MTEIKQLHSGLQQETVMNTLLCFMQLVHNMLGRAEDVNILSGMEIHVERSDKAESSVRETCMLFLTLYLGDYERAAKIGRHLQRTQNEALSGFFIQTMTFMAGLSEVLYARASSKKNLKAGKPALLKLKQWAKFCPDNVLSRIYLIEAERDSLMDNRDRAFRKFQSAIDLADEQGFVQEQALACELAAATLVGWERKREAREFYRQARFLYERWGSPVKVEQMNKYIEQAR
jgi:tetratricopeptide (TPR) repeat protein